MLTVGDKAPDFDMATDGAGRVALKALKGKTIVLYFYPKDDTSGCTAQACAFRDALPDFTKATAAVIGVSKDGTSSHDRFKQKHELTFTLASDTDGSVSEAYGTWVQKSMYGRTYMGIARVTYLIDRDGTVARRWDAVKVETHAADVLEALAALGAK